MHMIKAIIHYSNSCSQYLHVHYIDKCIHDIMPLSLQYPQTAMLGGLLVRCRLSIEHFSLICLASFNFENIFSSCFNTMWGGLRRGYASFPLAHRVLLCPSFLSNQRPYRRLKFKYRLPKNRNTKFDPMKAANIPTANQSHSLTTAFFNQEQTYQGPSTDYRSSNPAVHRTARRPCTHNSDMPRSHSRPNTPVPLTQRSSTCSLHRSGLVET